MPARSPSARAIAVPERDAGVLDRVVAVHVQIALRLDGQVEQRVAGQRLEHVVEEADAGLDPGLAAAVEHRPGRGDRFPWWCGGSRPTRTVTGPPGSAARICSSALSTASMSSSVPIEIRRHSASSAAPDTSRTRMPCSSSSRRKTSLAGRARHRISTKLAAVGNTSMPGDPHQPREEPLARLDHRAGSARRRRPRDRARPRRRPASPGSRCRAASPWRSRGPRPGAPARARTGARPCPSPWRRCGAPPGASSVAAAASRSGRRTPGTPRRRPPARRSPPAGARPRPPAAREPVGLLGELSTTTRARSRTAVSTSSVHVVREVRSQRHRHVAAAEHAGEQPVQRERRRRRHDRVAVRERDREGGLDQLVGAVPDQTPSGTQP